MNNILSVQTHNIRNIALIAGKQNNWLFQQNCFFLVAKISSKKVCKIMENNSTLEKALPACNRNAAMLRLVGASFDIKAASIKRMQNLIILKSLEKKSLSFFVLFVCRC